MGGLLTGKAFTQQFPSINTVSGNGSSSLQGTTVAIYEIGCFFGALISFFVGERLGRRWSIIIGCIVLSIGAAIQASAYSVGQLIGGRVIAGLGNGLNTATIPVWHSELMKPADRGRGLSVELAITILGVAMAYWIDFGMGYVSGPAQFRFPIALQILFALITAGGVVFLPETPRWLMAHGHKAEARHVLWRLQKNAHTIPEDHEVINAEVDEIQHALDEERAAAGGTGFLALFKGGPQRFGRRTLLGIGGQFMQQLSGINLIT